MKWFLVLYLVGSTEVEVSSEAFNTLEECGVAYNEMIDDLKKRKDIEEVRCEEVSGSAVKEKSQRL